MNDHELQQKPDTNKPQPAAPRKMRPGLAVGIAMFSPLALFAALYWLLGRGTRGGSGKFEEWKAKAETPPVESK